MMDRNSSGGRLSPLNIADPLLRVELYREIRTAQNDSKARAGNYVKFTIQPSEALAPDLLAYRAYGLDTLKWVVLIAAGLEEPRERLEDGETLWLPRTAWLRERIRYYADLEERK